MLFPKKNFQKYLEGEIDKETYRKNIFPEIIKENVFIALLTFLAFFLIALDTKFKNLSNVGLACALYLIVVMVIACFSYLKSEKTSRFFMDIKEENATDKNQQFPQPENLKRKTPWGLRKLYLEDKISKLEYVQSVFLFKMNALRIAFFLMFTLIIISTFSIKSGSFLLTKIGVAFLVSLFGTWFIKIKSGSISMIKLRITLALKKELLLKKIHYYNNFNLHNK